MVETTEQRGALVTEIHTAIRQMATYGLGGILVKAVGFFMLPFYTHYLSPSDYGVLEILDLSMSLFALVLNMGMTPALLRCYAGAQSPQEKRAVVSSGCIFGAVTGIATFALGVGLVRPASHLLLGPSIPSSYLLLSFSSIVLNYIATMPRTYIRALDASGSYTIVDTVYVFLLLGFNIVFIAVLRVGVIGVLWSSTIVGALQCVLLLGWAFRRAGWRFHWPHLDRMLRFGVPLIFSNLGLFVLNFSDRFFLEHFRSLAVVGIYAVGYKFGYMMNYLVVQPFFVMWQARMYAIHAQPDHRRIFKEFFSLYSVGLVYAGLAMSLFGSEAVRLMVEPKFAASQNVIPVVVLAYVFYGLSYYAQLGLFLTDNTGKLASIGASSAVVNLVLNAVLIYRYSMMGAAWATVLSFAFLAVFSYIRSQQVFPLPLGVGRLAAALALAAGMFVACRWLNPQSELAAIGLKLAMVGLFPAIVWKFGILMPSAEDTLRSAGAAALGVMGWGRRQVARSATGE